ncbi:MAG: hypothetical protein RQ745_07675 [Longimicrobiales bacterium]|nr:hypothetical protein [Longimicrobiales bacterium]
MRRGWVRPGLGLCALFVLVPHPGGAQQVLGEGCAFEPGTESAEVQSFATTRIISSVRPRIRCEDGVVLHADSLTYYEARGWATLRGNVFYADSTRSLTAVRAEYFRQARQLIANGDSATDVVVTDLEDEGRLTGPTLNYLQRGGGRIEDEITLFGGGSARPRPKARLPAPRPDSAEILRRGEPPTPATPFDVTADRIFLRGEDFFEAIGEVDGVRDSLTTHSDTLVFDQVIQTLDLRGHAALVQGTSRIDGRHVRVRLPDGEIHEIEARGEAGLLAPDLDLKAPWIRIAFVDGEVDGLWAAPLHRRAVTTETPPPGITEEVPSGDQTMTPGDSVDALQPVARSGRTTIRADSLDVETTAGALEQLVGVGRAHAVWERDSIDVSMLPEIAREDWMRGDTITVTFTPVVEGDSITWVLDRVVAAGNASSLYRLPPDSTSTAGTPAPDDRGALRTDSIVGRTDPPSDSTAVPRTGGGIEGAVETPVARTTPGIHYVVAVRIILIFEGGEVERMEVLGLEEGVYLQPRGRARRNRGPGGAS